MTATTIHRLVWLDPMSETEVAFAQGLLPETAFTVSALGSDADAAALREAEVILTRTQPVTAATLAAGPKVRLVQKYGGRPDRLDLDAARAAGVQVAIMPLRGCIA